MSDSLERILHAAKAVLDEAHRSYHGAHLTPGQIESVYHLRNDLGELLARFSDGKGYGSATNGTIIAMRGYEEMANSWLAAVCAAAASATHDEWKRVVPGRYVVTRTAANGVTFRRTECTNPAVATRNFDRIDDKAERN